MENRKLGQAAFILATAALAASASFALYALFLAPAETYSPPAVGAGGAVVEPILCGEADIPPPEGGVPEGYVWRVKPEACFGYPLPDFAYVLPPMQTVLDNGTVLGPPESFKTIDSSKATDGRFQLMNVGLIEDRSILSGTLSPVNFDELRADRRPDGDVIYYDEVRQDECGQRNVCTYQLAYVDFPDGGPVVSVMLNVFHEDYYSRGFDSDLPILTDKEITGVVETVARTVRLK